MERTGYKRKLGMVLGAAAMLLAAGCHSLALFEPPVNEPLEQDSLLTPHSNTSQDTVTLEVFFVRCPYGEKELNETLWQDVDEQVLSTSVRSNLLSNGFRVGLVGNQVPSSLLRILKTQDDDEPDKLVATVRLEDMAGTPRVMRSTVGSRNGQRNEINVSEIKGQETVLFNENGTPGGETFTDAQAVLAIKTQTRGDGGVDVEIVPELQYGQARQTFSYDAGAVMMATARPKKSFDFMRTEFSVMPGQIILMTNIGDLQGNLGYFFFTEENAELRNQKLLCIRVVQSQNNEMYSVDGRLPFDPAD